jgi:hypothetical protein
MGLTVRGEDKHMKKENGKSKLYLCSTLMQKGKIEVRCCAVQLSPFCGRGIRFVRGRRDDSFQSLLHRVLVPIQFFSIWPCC